MPNIKFRYRIRVVPENGEWAVYHGYKKLCSCQSKEMAVRIAKDYKAGKILTC